MNFRQFGAVALAAFLLVSMAAPAAVSVQSDSENDLVQNPSIDADVTKVTHEVGWDATDYENDNGEQDSLPASVNDSHDNPISYETTEANVDDFSAFPHSKENVSALTASEWTTDTSSSGGSASVAEASTAQNVDALSLSTSSQTDSDTAVFTFSNFSVTSDAEKRYLQVAYDVNTLDAGTSVEVRAVDSDGDYKVAEINTSRSSGEDFMTNQTGDGFVYQHQLGQLSTAGSGDGTFGEIQSVEVHVHDGNADIDIAALNVEKLSEYDFGDRRVDTDDDDDLETETITEVKTPGAVSIASFDSLGPAFENETLHHVTIPMQFDALSVADSEMSYEFSEAEGYPSFDVQFDLYYRLTLPDAYDLSYANARMTDDVKMPSQRYTAVEYAEGVSDTEFSDISSWSSVKSSYDTQGANVTIDDTIQPGTQIAFHANYLLTNDEESSAESILSSGGAVGPMGSGGGGVLDYVFSIPGMIISALAGLLGMRRRGWV